MSKEIKTLAEALGELSTARANLKAAEDLLKEKEDFTVSQSDYDALMGEKSAVEDKLAAEVDAHAATKSELATTKENLGSIKETLKEANLIVDGETSLKDQINTQASSKAHQIIAAQGGDEPLDTGANNPTGKETPKLTGLAAAAALFDEQIGERR